MKKRTGIILISVGLALAGLTAFLVVGVVRQATAASHAQVPQVAVVVATKDIPDETQITSDALEVKSFPADFAPSGAFSTPGDLVGKYAQGFIAKGGVIVSEQVQLAPAAPLLSDRIPTGMVVMWLPTPDALAGTHVLKPGDHVDLLLTAPVGANTGGDKQINNLSTQTTLQNIEVYRIGDDELGVPPAAPADPGNQAGITPSPQSTANSRQSIGLLIDHQSAVTMKFIKDAGGTIDLVTRSADDPQIARTDGVTLDTLADQFHFRIPQAAQTQPVGA